MLNATKIKRHIMRCLGCSRDEALKVYRTAPIERKRHRLAEVNYIIAYKLKNREEAA